MCNPVKGLFDSPHKGSRININMEIFIFFLRPLQPHTGSPYGTLTSTVLGSFGLPSLPGSP